MWVFCFFSSVSFCHFLFQASFFGVEQIYICCTIVYSFYWQELRSSKQSKTSSLLRLDMYSGMLLKYVKVICFCPNTNMISAGCVCLVLCLCRTRWLCYETRWPSWSSSCWLIRTAQWRSCRRNLATTVSTEVWVSTAEH